MLCLNSLTRGRCPLGPPLLPERPISTIKNGWSKFCSIEPNFLISPSSMASRAQRTAKDRARFGPIFFRSSVEMYRSENLLAEPTFSFFQRNLRLTLIDRRRRRSTFPRKNAPKRCRRCLGRVSGRRDVNR